MPGSSRSSWPQSQRCSGLPLRTPTITHPARSATWPRTLRVATLTWQWGTMPPVGSTTPPSTRPCSPIACLTRVAEAAPSSRLWVGRSPGPPAKRRAPVCGRPIGGGPGPPACVQETAYEYRAAPREGRRPRRLSPACGGPGDDGNLTDPCSTAPGGLRGWRDCAAPPAGSAATQRNPRLLASSSLRLRGADT
jgi:hypothetical protein